MQIFRLGRRYPLEHPWTVAQEQNVSPTRQATNLWWCYCSLPSDMKSAFSPLSKTPASGGITCHSLRSGTGGRRCKRRSRLSAPSNFGTFFYLFLSRQFLSFSTFFLNFCQDNFSVFIPSFKRPPNPPQTHPYCSEIAKSVSVKILPRSELSSLTRLVANPLRTRPKSTLLY